VASSKKEEAKGLYRIGGQLWKVNPGKEGAMKVLLMALGIYEGPNYRGQPGMTMQSEAVEKYRTSRPGTGLVRTSNVPTATAHIDTLKHIEEMVKKKGIKGKTARDLKKIAWQASKQPSMRTTRAIHMTQQEVMAMLPQMATFQRNIGKNWAEKFMYEPIYELVYGKDKQGRIRWPDPRGGRIPRIAPKSARAQKIAAHTLEHFGVAMRPDTAIKFIDTMSKTTESIQKGIAVGDIKASDTMRKAIMTAVGMYKEPSPKGAGAFWGKHKGRKKAKAAQEKKFLVRGKLAKVAAGAGDRAAPTKGGFDFRPQWKAGEKILPEEKVKPFTAAQKKVARKFVLAAEKVGVKRDKIRTAVKTGAANLDIPGIELAEAVEGPGMDDIIEELRGGQKVADAAGGEAMFGMSVHGDLPAGRFGELEKDMVALKRMAETYVKKQGLPTSMVPRVANILGTVAGTAGVDSQAALEEAMSMLQRVETMLPHEAEGLMKGAASVGAHQGLARGEALPSKIHPGESRWVLEEMGFGAGQGEQALHMQESLKGQRYAKQQGTSQALMEQRLAKYQASLTEADIAAYNLTLKGSQADYVGPQLLKGRSWGSKPMTVIPTMTELVMRAKEAHKARNITLTTAEAQAMVKARGMKYMSKWEVEKAYSRMADVLRWKRQKEVARATLVAGAKKGYSPRAMEAKRELRESKVGSFRPDVPRTKADVVMGDKYQNKILEARRTAQPLVTPTVEGAALKRVAHLPPAIPLMPKPKPEMPRPSGPGVRDRPPRELLGASRFHTGFPEPDPVGALAREQGAVKRAKYRKLLNKLVDKGIISRKDLVKYAPEVVEHGLPGSGSYTKVVEQARSPKAVGGTLRDLLRWGWVGSEARVPPTPGGHTFEPGRANPPKRSTPGIRSIGGRSSIPEGLPAFFHRVEQRAPIPALAKRNPKGLAHLAKKGAARGELLSLLRKTKFDPKKLALLLAVMGGAGAVGGGVALSGQGQRA
jgi:hypothetical protein